MKNSLLYVLFVSAFFSVNAQSGKNVEKGLFKVNALIPGVSYELGVGTNTSFNFDVGILLALEGGTNVKTEFGLFPTLGADFRYYYNMDRRIGKGKNILGNSGNYLGVANQFYPGNAFVGNLDFTSSYFYNTAVVYGIQRMRPKGFYWGVSFGPGLFVDDFDVNGGLFVDAKLGWVIGKRK
ncbi:MAG: hypothetical protein WBG48_15705 [Pricia sp.]